MRRLTVLTGLFFLTTGILAGCSGGEKATEPTLSSEEQYELLKPTIDLLIGNVLVIAGSGLNEFDQFAPILTPPPPVLGRIPAFEQAQIDGDTVYQNGWYILSYSDQTESETLSMIDSVRFMDSDGLAQSYPDEETTNAVHMIQHASVTFAYEGMTGSIGDYADFSFNGFQAAVVSVNGVGLSTMEFSAVDERGTSSMDLAFATELTDFTFPNPSLSADSCPLSGTIVMTITGAISAFDENDNLVSGQVDATVTVTILSNGNAMYTAVLEGTQYSETINVCADI